MKRRILSMLCAVATVLGMIVVPAYATDTAADSAATVLTENAVDLTVTGDTYIDLNGYDIIGVTVEEGTLYVSDSKTDDYTVADGDFGTVTGITGSVKAAEGYLAVTEAEAVSYHRVDLSLNSMSLRPAVAGVYYNSNFAGDEKVAAQVESYGVALSVVAEPDAENIDTLCGYSVLTGFAAGKNSGSGTLLTGIMTESNTDFANNRNASMDVYGRAYIKTAEGYVFGDCVARNLKTQVEDIDAIFASLNETQQASILAMYAKFEAVMTEWNVPNMKAAAAGSIVADTVITVPVETVNGEVLETVTVEQDGVTITVPFGALVDSNELILTVTKKAQSDSGIEAEEGQTLMPFDVHVEGISKENTEPLTVALGEVMPKNLNMGNYTIYHVEEDGTKEMTLVENDEEFDAHNQFKYDLDGNLTLNMASFSEIAALSENENGWKNGVDHSWYLNTITEDPNATYFEIRNADQLWSLSQIVGGMAENIARDSFSGKTIKLLADINMADGEDAEHNNNVEKIFYPIGYNSDDGKYEKTGVAVSTGFYAFMGTFDGNGNTISNIYQNTWEMKGDHEWYSAAEQNYRDGMGLFGKVYGGTVKNLTVDNFKSDGEITTTGVIAAYADGATFENIAIFNCNPRVYNIGNGGIVGCAGWYAKEANLKTTFTNITVDNSNKISALWGTYDASCGGILGQYYPTSGQSSAGSPKNAGIEFVNCHVAAEMDVNNDVCGNYQYYWYRYCGMFIGSLRDNKTDDNGYTVGDATGIYAENCTYNIGQWNNYYYCELVANSKASYTHDHQMSRLTIIDSIGEIKDENGWTKAGNFLLIDGDTKTCYHIVKDAEGNLGQHTHESAGYEDSIDENGDGAVDLKEDKQIIYLPFNQLMTGYGWGVKAYQEFAGISEDQKQLAQSSEKFTAVMSQGNVIPTSTKSVAFSELFGVKDGAEVNESTVHVYISPVGEESTVTAACVCVTDGKLNNIAELPIAGEGAAKITVTDYYYCTPTVLYVTIGEAAEPVEKFEATAITNVGAEKTVTLGELFTALPDVTIDNATVDITVTGGTYEYEKNETDWTQSTVAFTDTATYTVKITDADNCISTERTVTVDPIDKFDYVFENTDKYLYRVGNADGSTVALNLLFKALEGVKIDDTSVSVEITTIYGNATGAYTPNTANWTQGTIQFSNTGVVKVTISATNANSKVLYLEVVDATNVVGDTMLSGTGKNFVMLSDVTYSDTYLYYKNSTVYGNGFTLDITGADHSDLKDTSDTSSNKSAYCNIWLVNSRFDNIKVLGSVYPEVGMTADSDYGNAAIRTEGICYITNSYISNTRVPLRVQGDTILENTIVDGGRYANIELRSGQLVLDEVTTINTLRKDSDNTTDVIGFGIVIHSEAANCGITVKDGGLKQYNWVGETEHKTVLSGDTNLSSAYKLIFNANNSDRIYFDYNNDRYVNTGILCLCADMEQSVVSGLDDRYCQAISGYDAWVLTYDNSKHTTWFDESVTVEEIKFNPEQGSVVPNYDGDEDQTVEFTKGETYYFDTSVLTAEKYAQTLTISSVVMNDTTYNYGDKIAITEGGILEIVYTVEDPYNYNADASAATTVNHTVSITVTAIAKDAEILDPKFTFIDQNGNKYESTVVKAGDKTYVMPNVTAADPTTNSMSSINIGSVSISGTTVYFPVATGYTVRSGSNFNRYYPLFNGINITDYTVAGDTTGTTYTTSGNYTSLVGSSGTKFIIPANGGQTNCGDYVKTDGQAGNAAGNSDSGWQGAGYSTSYGGTYLKSGNTSASSGADSNGYERIVWVEYSFNAGNGDVYYYRIGYHCNKESAQSCFTSDTLITLADGTQKRVDELSFNDKILAWDFFTGSYVEKNISLLVNHGTDQNDVIYTEYSDGSLLKLIGEHGVFDYDLNEFVYITAENVEEYIGHRFVKYNSQGGYDIVTMSNGYVVSEYVEAWSVSSAVTSNAFASGLLTVAPPEDFYNWIEMDGKLHYDVEKFAHDVETYGLYTHEDFKDYVTYEQFVDWNGAYLRIPVEKGYFTFEYILELIELYKSWMPA